MSHVLTLVAPPGGLDAPCVARAADALRSLGATVGEADTLSVREAADLPFSGADPGHATAAVRTAMEALPVDVIASAAAGRRKRVLVADMDSTVVTSETLDELADFAGLKDRVAEITRRTMNGELDFAASLRARVGLLRGLPVTALEATHARVVITPGARSLVRTMVANGATCAIASGGFTFFTARVARACGFQLDFANRLIEDGDVLAGTVAEPIFDANGKLATLRDLAARAGVGLEDTAAVGDGANDLPMIGAAGMGVAWRAKPVVAAAARARVDHADLRALLFAQGYRAAEILPDA